MKVKFANKIFEVLYTKKVAGQTMYAVEDEPNHIDWLVNVEVVDSEKKELKKVEEEDVKLTEFESALFSAFSYAWQEYLIGREVNVAKWAKEHSAELLEVAREQKTAWSEEDDIEISVLINALGELETYGGDFSKQKNWLKTIKERVRPQSKQEWSEEDEKYFNVLYKELESYIAIKGYYTPLSCADLDWLKSLKERYTWKPTDEQMEALLKLEEMHVLEHEKNQENAHLYMVVKSIREQLLKLKENKI